VPLHEYQCDRCGRFELIHKFSDPTLLACPTCGGEVQKLLSSPAIQFKGSGFYVNDYAKKSSGKEGESKGPETSSSASGDGKGASKDGSGDGKGASKDTSGDDKAASKDASASPDKGKSKDSSATGSSPAK